MLGDFDDGMGRLFFTVFGLIIHTIQTKVNFRSLIWLNFVVFLFTNTHPVLYQADLKSKLQRLRSMTHKAKERYTCTCQGYCIVNTSNFNFLMNFTLFVHRKKHSKKLELYEYI